ncbi:uncharacterized protein LOC121780146 [Salvia splendens]|uniref:uncharacterized protein LOC121780146 n=1 Tax=Salvia splendens TaxID=180675 RepID=UPI001C27136B|nr:uncharacterized protein LOC121780146 [Salvia splendens]
MQVNDPPPEPQECPVCLQLYDATAAIPRVLSCGHTTCEVCLKLLPRPFPNTIRCTVCTLLLKLPNSLSSLPKNLDLLYFSSLLQRTRPLEEKTPIPPDFKGAESVYSPSVLKPWPYEFYCKWGRWILPKDCILIGGRPLDGKVLWCFESDRVVGCVFSENDHVGLIKVGIFMGGEDDSEIIKPSYESRILTFLWGMGEDERDKLGVVFKACFRVSSLGKAFGFWCNEEDRSVYIVCQKLASSSFIDCVFNRRKDEEERLIADEIRFWGVVGVEICEILMRLHLEGLTVGYLSLNCLGFDDFGRVCVDLSEVLKSGRRVSKNVEFGLKDMFLEHNAVFLCPEVLLQLFVKAGFELDSRNVSKVGPVSDVWSLASLLVCVLVGSSFEEEMESFLHYVVNAVKDEKGCDYDGLYLAWMGKVSALLKSRLGSDFASLLDVLCRCLGLEPGHRPLATELWKCLRGLVVKPQCDIGFTLKNENKNQESGGYIVLGDVCCMVDGTGHGSKGEEEAERDDARLRVEGDVVDGITRGDFKCLEVKGTGLHGIYYRNVSHVK